MTIEFADPGFPSYLILTPAIIMFVGLILFALPFFLIKEDSKNWRDWYPVPGVAVTFVGVLMLVGFGISSGSVYADSVRDAKREALQGLGYTQVEFTGGESFTANEGGKFFNGALIDLQPAKDYAFEVVELTAKD